MKRISFWKLSLLVCGLLISPVLHAQTKETPSGDKVVLLTTGKVDQRRMAVGISAIMPSADAAEAMTAEGQVAGRARLEGNFLVIDFTAPLPEKSQRLMVEPKLSLESIGGQCLEVKSGTYSVARSRAGNGSVRLLVVPTNPSAIHRPWHGWFHTRCVDCCGKFGRGE